MATGGADIAADIRLVVAAATVVVVELADVDTVDRATAYGLGAA